MPGKPNLSTNIFQSLKSRIIRWNYPPGYHLTEEELCQEFTVSRVPVREALRMLAENGLVERTPHRGCMVKLPDLTTVHELYDVRLALELFVVAQLSERGLDAESHQGLLATWENLQQAPSGQAIDSLYLAQQDAQFHEALARSTGNRQLYEQLQQIDERLYFMRLHDITTQARLQITCEQHLHILACIAAGAVEAAQAAIRANIEFGRSNVEQALKEALAKAYLGPIASPLSGN